MVRVAVTTIRPVKVTRRKSGHGRVELTVTIPAKAREIIGDPEFMMCEVIVLEKENGEKVTYVAYRPIS